MAVSAWIRALPPEARGRHDDAGATSAAPLPVPILVDATGRRAKVVRTAGLFAAVGTLALLATLPLSLVLPEHVQGGADVTRGPSSTATMQGVLYVDTDCDGTHGRTEPTVGSMQVLLFHDGVSVATTRADSAGQFAFAHVAAHSTYEVRLSEPSSSNEPGDASAPATVTFAVATTAGTDLMAFGVPQQGSACPASARAVPGDLRSSDDAAPRPLGN